MSPKFSTFAPRFRPVDFQNRLESGPVPLVLLEDAREKPTSNENGKKGLEINPTYDIIAICSSK